MEGQRGARGCTAGWSGRNCPSGCRWRATTSTLVRGRGLVTSGVVVSTSSRTIEGRWRRFPGDWAAVECRARLAFWMGRANANSLPLEPRSWVRGLEGNAMAMAIGCAIRMFTSVTVEAYILRGCIVSLRGEGDLRHSQPGASNSRFRD